MKPSKKVVAALNRRLDSYVSKSAAGFACVKPGSQNRKKGASVSRSGR